ncbi:MAG: AI-2E family transporter [Lachnospiraceae bacterium]|nr:AI-2E family transporter [Lachnospiraceae bacterium]
MKLKFEKKYIMIGIIAFFVIASSICFYYLVFHGDRFSAKINALMIIASPILYGIILAYLLTPIVNNLETNLLIPLFLKISADEEKKRKIMRFLSVAITIILVVLLIKGFFSILIPNLITSIRSISNQFPTYVENLIHFTDRYFENNPDIEKIFAQVLDTYSEQLNDFINNNVITRLESLVKTVSLSMIGVLKSLWNLIIGLVISIYVLFSKETFSGQAKKIMYAFFPTRTANGLIKDFRFVSDTFIGFISGKIIDSFIIGVICFAGTSLLKMPYALLISVIVGITNIIPFFGPYLGAIPSAILILMVDPIKCIYFIIFILILQQVDGNVIGPKILGESTGLSGFWVIFSITLFGGIMGIPGMIIGVPFFAVLYAMAKRIISRHLTQKGLSTATKDYMNLEYIKGYEFVPKDDGVKKKFFKLSIGKKAGSKPDHKKEEDKSE